MTRMTVIAMNGPIPPIPLDRPTPAGVGGAVWRSLGNVAERTDGFAVAGPTDPDGIGCGWPTWPVGSNSTQPELGKYTSTHQWADAAETTSRLSLPRLPGRKP